MVMLMIGRERIGKTLYIKSQIMELLQKGNRVCVLCLERDLNYYQDMRWRSSAHSIEEEDINKIKTRRRLTIYTHSDQILNKPETAFIDFDVIDAILSKNFDYVFIDDGQHLLQNFIQTNQLDELFLSMNDFYQTQVIIAIQSLNQLTNNSTSNQVVNQ